MRRITPDHTQVMAALIGKAQELMKGRPQDAADAAFVNHLIDAFTAMTSKITKDVRGTSLFETPVSCCFHYAFRLLKPRAPYLRRSHPSASKSPTIKTAQALPRGRQRGILTKRAACEPSNHDCCGLRSLSLLTPYPCLRRFCLRRLPTSHLWKNGIKKGFTP